MNNINDRNARSAPRPSAAALAASPKKISMRQVMILFFFASVSGMTRVAAPGAGQFVGRAGWLAPFAALVPVLLLVYALNKIIERHKERALCEIIELVFGKVAGKIILALFLAHTLFLTAVFLHNFGEKFILTVLPDVAPQFFTVSLLLFAVTAARRSIAAFARFAEVAFIITAGGLIILFVLAVFRVDPLNLYPVAYYDLASAAWSSLPLASLWSLVTFSLFLGGTVKHKAAQDGGHDKTAQTMTKFMLIIALFNFLSSILIIGIFSAETAAGMSMPYLMVFRSIGIIRGFDTFFMLLWALTDFIMIAYLLFVMSSIFKTLCAVEKPRLYMFTLGFIILILSWLIGDNMLEVDYFYANILSWGSVVLGFAFPFILLAAGKLRKLI